MHWEQFVEHLPHELLDLYVPRGHAFKQFPFINIEFLSTQLVQFVGELEQLRQVELHL